MKAKRNGCASLLIREILEKNGRDLTLLLEIGILSLREIAARGVVIEAVIVIGREMIGIAVRGIPREDRGQEIEVESETEILIGIDHTEIVVKSIQTFNLH
jgi:hypothetical protein